MASNRSYIGYDFYNRKGQKITIKIMNNPALPGSTTYVRIVSARIKYTQDRNIISSSMDMEIINDSGDFNKFDPLLYAEEREFQVLLLIDDITVWEGWLINDLSEQNLGDYSIIKFTFTDYLKRLEDVETPEITLGEKSYLLQILRQCLNLTGWAYDLRLNTNFYPEGAWAVWGNDPPQWFYSMYEQVQVMNDVFFQDELTTQSAYNTIQNILEINHSFLYVYKGKWYIEQYSQITDPSDDSEGGHWMDIIHGVGSSALEDSTYDPDENQPADITDIISSQLTRIHKQDGDFKYIEQSQRLQYESGLKELEIKLSRNTFDTLVLNNFSEDPLSISSYGFSNDAYIRKWGASEFLDTDYFAVGYNYRGINKFLRYIYAGGTSPFRRGVSQVFEFSYNSKGDFDNPTMLSVRYKWTSPNFDDVIATGDRVQVIGRISIRNVTSGDPDQSSFLKVEDGVLSWDNGGLPAAHDDNIQKSYIGLTPKLESSKVVEFTYDFDITQLWESGTPVDQAWNITFLATLYRYANGDDDIDDNDENLVGTQIIGDIGVNVSAGTEDNIINYEVTDDFFKKESFELTLFDTPNFNYRNGLLYDNERTSLWGMGDPSVGDGQDQINLKSIIDHYASFLYSYYSETRLILTARIDIDEFLKPLTIITDDNIYKDSESIIMDFILFEYEYDLYTNIMRIRANEYGNEDINIIES